MFRSLLTVLLLAGAASAGAPPKAAPLDPFEIGRMGIQFGTDNELAISSIEPTLPVAKSGLQPGDVFVQVGTVAARQRSDVQRFVFGLRPGTKIKVVVQRDSERKEFTVVLGEANDEIKASARRLANPNSGDDDDP